MAIKQFAKISDADLAKFRKAKPASQPVRQPNSAPVEVAAPLPEKPKWQAHNIPTPLHLLLAHRKDKKPYQWQAETLFQLAGYNVNDLSQPPTRPTDKIPLYYNLVAANGSGKDQIVIAAFAAWFALSKVRSRCIITSSSYEQLKDQTFKYIKTLCEDINIFHGRKVFEIVEFQVTCNDTGSEIKCFVTDDPGKAEGRHPFDDFEGSEMAVIVNEAKSIADEMFQAFSRFTGYNYWIEISSPGPTTGHFYRRCTMAEYCWPANITLGEFYWRRITAFDCDHLLGKHIDNLKKEYGENSLLYRSQVLAEFTTLDEAAFISSMLFENYPKLPSRTFGLKNRAGLDLAMGGDEMVMYVFMGGKLHMRRAKHEKVGAIVQQIITWIKEFGLDPSEIRADDGGSGKAILDRLEELGYAVIRVRNEQRASNPNFYKNRGAENWNRIKRLAEDKLLPNIDDPETILQLTKRGYKVTGLVTQLEKKPEMKARGLSSPDRADALALCFDGVALSTFQEGATVSIVNNDPQSRFDELLMIGRNRQLTPDEQTELMCLFTTVAERRKPARQSLDGDESETQNRGLFHIHLQ